LVQEEVPVAGAYEPPSTLTATLATPPESEALPETERTPPTLAPAAGAAIATAGGVVSAFETVKLTLAVEELPAASVARAVRVCEPSAYSFVSRLELQLVVPCAAAYAPPSTLTATLATWTLSDAVPETAIVPRAVAPAAGAETATDGGEVSARGLPPPPPPLPALAVPAEAKTKNAIPAATRRRAVNAADPAPDPWLRLVRTRRRSPSGGRATGDETRYEREGYRPGRSPLGSLDSGTHRAISPGSGVTRLLRGEHVDPQSPGPRERRDRDDRAPSGAARRTSSATAGLSGVVGTEPPNCSEAEGASCVPSASGP
jgi:hypothetical protein